jgi:endoglucanase
MNRTVFLLFFFVSLMAKAGGISINQAGYLTDAPKYFFINEPADSFYLHDASDGKLVFKGTIRLKMKNDPASGMDIYKGDFSAFEAPGKYYIALANGKKSPTFEISDTVYNNLFNASLKSYYYQRCGVGLESKYAGEFKYGKCHTKDARFHPLAGEGYKDVTGGWHDAGDYGKYVVNAGVTVGTLLMAYELFPAKFLSDSLNIPESGNRIPDILDEALFEIDWMLKMQREDGAVFTKVTKEKFEDFVMPDKDVEEGRLIYHVSSTATADFAAVLAKASRLIKDYDKDLAKKYLDAATAAWKFLADNPGIIPRGGFKNPEGTVTGEYGDRDDSDERAWAAAELFMSTGDKEYLDYFTLYARKNNFRFKSISWSQLNDLAYFTILANSSKRNIPADIKDKIKAELLAYSDYLTAKSERDGYGVTILPGEYRWGCNSDVLNNALILIVGYEITGDKNFYNLALGQLNYILGANAHQISFVTGIGADYVRHPHHRPTASDGIEEPVPGFLSGGPNQNLQDPVLVKLFDKNTPPAMCYADDTGSWSSNEIAINWNAPLVFVSGYFK